MIKLKFAIFPINKTAFKDRLIILGTFYLTITAIRFALVQWVRFRPHTYTLWLMIPFYILHFSHFLNAFYLLIDYITNRIIGDWNKCLDFFYECTPFHLSQLVIALADVQFGKVEPELKQLAQINIKMWTILNRKRNGIFCVIEFFRH